MNDPIKKTVIVPLSAKDAFDLFTSDMDLWWPKSGYSVFGSKARLRFPTLKGERIVETSVDGEETIWGEVIAFEPGHYVAFTWHPGRDRQQATVVEMRFVLTEAGTRCELTHGGFEILGETADAVSTSYLRGWDMVLGCYCIAAKAPVMA